jgi:hypothetical protein
MNIFCSCNKLGTLFLALFLFGMGNAQAQAWQRVTSGSSYDNRDEHGYVEVNGKFYLVGGAYMGRPRVQEYDPNTNSWTNKSAPPIDFHHLQPVSHHGLVWIVCSWQGNYGSEANVSHVWTYDPALDSWTQKMAIPSNRRRGSAGVIVHNDKFYILGGNSGGHGPQGDVKNWVDVYDPNANNGAGSWTVLADMPIGRDHFQAVEKNGKIYAIGGRDSGTSGNFFATVRPQVDIYDIATNSWTTLPSSADLPTLRAGSCNVVMDDEIIVLLGVGNSRQDEKKEVEAFDINTHSWRSLPQPQHARSGTQAIAFGRDIWVASGIGSVYGGTDLYEQEKLHIPSPAPGPPQVSAPADVTIVAGGNATFQVTASPASPNLSYRWERRDPSQSNWLIIPGANQASYVLSNVSPQDDSTEFRCQVSNNHGSTYSEIALLSVRCNGIFMGSTDPIVMEAEHYHYNLASSGQAWQLRNESGSEGVAMASLPNQGTNYNTNFMGQSPELLFDINFGQSGSYFLWLRMLSPSYADNSVHAGLDSVVFASSARITYDTYNQWGWTNLNMDGNRVTLQVNSPGIHRFHLWMREDGALLDRILLTRDANYTPSGMGPNESNSCFPAQAFPVDLAHFEAKAEAARVQLNWQTASELNNAYFEVQKSQDQLAWQVVGSVAGAGSSQTSNRYEFFDEEPWSGKTFYRLKQVDVDGRYSLSSVTEVYVEPYQGGVLYFYPNPVWDRQLRVRVGVGQQKGVLSLLNLHGREVKQASFQSATAHLRDVQWALSELPAGVYFLQWKSGDQLQLHKLILP